ncbi:hypothetical protein EYF80_002561 [Liparis tanakae]|uniref:Uncharacterized protein n=1 Tax=Liparis tanakae TaxID=230148 RepID=A0A4Z2JB68_9TELE|nr:hypothetical protein EYF80_002561 [Liparis tanakae]
MESAVLFLLFFSSSPVVSRGQMEASVPRVETSVPRVEASVARVEAAVLREDAVRMGGGVAPELPVLWDQLQGLKELVLSVTAVEVEQRQALRSIESRLRDRELLMERNSDLRRKVEELEEQSKGVDYISGLFCVPSRRPEAGRLSGCRHCSESLTRVLQNNSPPGTELPALEKVLYICHIPGGDFMKASVGLEHTTEFSEGF